MNTTQALLIIVFSGFAGMLGATYVLNNNADQQQIVILDIKEWSQSLLDDAREKGLSKQDIEVEKRILAKDVNKALGDMVEKGVIVLDARSVLNAPANYYLDRAQQ